MANAELNFVLTFSDYLKRKLGKGSKSGKLILVEMQGNKSAQIAQATFLEALSDTPNQIVPYSPYVNTPIYKIFTYLLMIRLGFLRVNSWPFSIYKSIGSKKLLFVKSIRINVFERRKLIADFEGLSKQEILDFRYCGIRVGDLFYDWYLRISGLPTLEVTSSTCQKSFIQFLGGVIYWSRFFEKNQVSDLLVTHSVYDQAIPVRFGLINNTRVYLVTSDRCFRLNNEDYLSDLEFKYYDPRLASFNGYEIDLDRAKRKIENLFSGQIGVDIAHAFVSGLHGARNERIIGEPNQINVLIAAHCFSDSPHANGDHIFPDFWEWLLFISEIALNTKYNWYIKAHPAFFESDKKIFEDFCLNNPHIKSISSDFSNLELIKQGVNVVLTVYGTIAFEAAYLGAVVIDASKNTPHMNYGFSLKPHDKFEYQQLLSNLEEIVERGLEFDSKEILHFYDAHHLRKSDNWLFGDHYERMLEELGSVAAQYSSPRIYDFWINLVMSTDHTDQLKTKIRDFVDSERYAF